MIKDLELWQKNLIGLSISQFLYRAATRSLLPYLPLFIKELGKTSFGETAIWSGWIYSAPFIISFFVTPFWGSYGDMHGRKRITLFAAFGFAAAHFLMGLANSLPMLLFFASLQEAFGGFYPASVSLVATNTPKDKTAYALGILQSSSAAGNVAGPILGGLLAYFVGYQSVFFIVAIPVTFGGFIILFFVEEKEFAKETHEYFTLLKNIKYIQTNKFLISSVLFLFIYSVGVTLLRPTFTLFIESLMHSARRSPAIAGILFTIFGAMAAISSAFLGKITKKIDVTVLIAFMSIITAICFLMVPVFNSLFTVAVFLTVCGFAVGLILPSINTLISNNVDKDRKAGVFGIGSSSSTLGNLVGGITVGYFVSSLGLKIPFVLSGLLFITITLIRSILIKKPLNE